MLFTQEQVRFSCSSRAKHHPFMQELNASSKISTSLSLFLRFSNKRAAFRVNTPTLHVQPAQLRTGAQGRTSPATKNPPWSDTIFRATPSHNATSTKTQTPAWIRLDTSGEAFVSHSLAVLRRSCTDAGADQMFPALRLRAAGTRTG